MLNWGVWKKRSFWIHSMENSVFFQRWTLKIPASSVFVVSMHIAIDSLVMKTLFWDWFWLEFRQFLIQLHWGLQLSQNVKVKSKKYSIFIFQKWKYPVGGGALDVQRLNEITSHCSHWFHVLWKGPHSSFYY